MSNKMCGYCIHYYPDGLPSWGECGILGEDVFFNEDPCVDFEVNLFKPDLNDEEMEADKEGN